MIAVFKDDKEIIVVGLNADESPMDKDGTLFGPKSGRDISKFERCGINQEKGEVVTIEMLTTMRAYGQDE